MSGLRIKWLNTKKEKMQFRLHPLNPLAMATELPLQFHSLLLCVSLSFSIWAVSELHSKLIPYCSHLRFRAKPWNGEVMPSQSSGAALWCSIDLCVHIDRSAQHPGKGEWTQIPRPQLDFDSKPLVSLSLILLCQRIESRAAWTTPLAMDAACSWVCGCIKVDCIDQQIL